MLFAAIALLVAALVALAYGLGVIGYADRKTRQRVDAVAAAQPTVRRRVSEPNGGSLLSWLSPAPVLRRLERNWVLAGRPDTWTRGRILVAKPLGAAIGVAFAFLIIVNTDSLLLMLFGLAMIPLGYFTPDLLLYNQATKRQESIQNDLPDTMDQIVISIQAGVGFEAALMRAGHHGTGPLADELVRLNQDISLGMSRKDAYLALAERTSVEELRGFARAIVQAEQYGGSVSSMVRAQAKEMRASRRARAEEKAQKVPVKILLPLMLCVLPVLFIVVLGPAIVNAFTVL